MQSGFDALDRLSVHSTALFLDFDGTLAGIVERPEDVRVAPKTLRCLVRAHERLDGAMAIVTGRDLATLDAFLTPYVFPASGVHGFEMRTADGIVHRRSADLDGLHRVAQQLSDFAGGNEGLLLERKPGSIALHYRQRPDLEAACRQAAIESIAAEAGLRMLSGKMVIEIKAHQSDKGQAILQFLDEPPFCNRLAVFIGDDVTDEAAFAAVNAIAGVSIKVGAGETVAAFRLDDPIAVQEWLNAFAGDGKHQGQLEGIST